MDNGSDNTRRPAWQDHLPMTLDDPNGVRERLWKAVSALAASAQPIQFRLEVATRELLLTGADAFEDADARANYEAILSISTQGGTTDIHQGTAALSDEEAVDLAERIVGLDAMYRSFL